MGVKRSLDDAAIVGLILQRGLLLVAVRNLLVQQALQDVFALAGRQVVEKILWHHLIEPGQVVCWSVEHPLEKKLHFILATNGRCVHIVYNLNFSDFSLGERKASPLRGCTAFVFILWTCVAHNPRTPSI